MLQLLPLICRQLLRARSGCNTAHAKYTALQRYTKVTQREELSSKFPDNGLFSQRNLLMPFYVHGGNPFLL
jgi:hypothetical protein